MGRTFFATPDGMLETGLPLVEVRKRLDKNGGHAWIDLEAPSGEDLRALGSLFGFHPLALEDCLNPHTHPKIEEYERAVFLVSRPVVDLPETIQVETTTLFAFLTADCLVTVHPRALPGVASTEDRLAKYGRLLAEGPDRILHQLLDHVVDEYFPLLDQLDEEVDQIQELIFTRESPRALERVFRAKQAVVALRRAVAPQREILTALAGRRVPYVRPESQAYFRDIYDHALRIVESLETLRDELTTLVDAHLSQTSNRLNHVMKTLSVVAVLALPLTIVTSFFGMNFERMPLIRASYGVWSATCIMIAFVLAGIAYLRWKRWF